MKVLALAKEKLQAIVWFKELTILLSIGALYFTMLVANPTSYLTGISTFSSLGNIRFANILASFGLFMPSAAVGIAGATYLFNVYSGKMAFGAFYAMPFIVLGISLFLNRLSSKWGRSIIKDITLIGIMSLLVAFVTSSNNVFIAAMFNNEAVGFTVFFAILWKAFTRFCLMVTGYPLVKFIEKTFKH